MNIIDKINERKNIVKKLNPYSDRYINDLLDLVRLEKEIAEMKLNRMHPAIKSNQKIIEELIKIKKVSI